MNASTSPTVASASLYASDVAKIEDFILRGKIAAQVSGEPYRGITLDIDGNGFIDLFTAGIDPITL